MEAPDRKPSPLAQTSSDFVPANKLNKGLDGATTVGGTLSGETGLASRLAAIGQTPESGFLGGSMISRTEHDNQDGNRPNWLFGRSADLPVLPAKVEERISFAHHYIFDFGNKDCVVSGVLGTVETALEIG